LVQIKHAGVGATHRFKFDEMLEAYDAFSKAAETHALKVLIVA
jgi:alcohol dehydrogenase